MMVPGDSPAVTLVEVPWGALPESSRALRESHLRLLLKEREATVAKLVDLDYAIWALEECFRGEP
ncbi:MAG: hypothetical protein JRN28_04250 [Nitrososphaerota archaeon]|nr:hypothetical protein [Nitrososphaerota archaeon]